MSADFPPLRVSNPTPKPHLYLWCGVWVCRDAGGAAGTGFTPKFAYDRMEVQRVRPKKRGKKA